jgi:hypothetical protein
VAQPSFIVRQRGITLMEIMISMGIALIGIMGIMALMPMAANNLGKGIEADAASTFGRGALHQMTSRNMIQGDIIAWGYNENTDQFIFDNGNPAIARWAPNKDERSKRSFCIDPMYVGEHSRFIRDPANNLNIAFPGVLPTTVVMPYYGPGTEPAHSHPRMLRASTPLFPSTNSPRPIVTALARQICVGQDDLAFARPKDPTLPPVQAYERFDDQSTATYPFAPRLRQSAGRFSWMATIVPEIDRSGSAADEFRRLSIVVFHDRVIDPSLTPIQTGVEHQELLFDVDLVGGGLAGGDVTLYTRPGRLPEDLEEIRQGDWIMLGGTIRSTGRPQFRWYRVIDTSPNTFNATYHDGTDIYGRDVTLVGPDWVRFEWVGDINNPRYQMNVSPKNNWNNGKTRTQATWVRGVVSVLEKNIAVDAHDHH